MKNSLNSYIPKKNDLFFLLYTFKKANKHL